MPKEWRVIIAVVVAVMYAVNVILAFGKNEIHLPHAICQTTLGSAAATTQSLWSGCWLVSVVVVQSMRYLVGGRRLGHDCTE